jgi:hypothetical protein
MGENKTLNLKDVTLLTFASYHAIDIHIKFCVGNSLSITIYDSKPEVVWQNYPFSAKNYRLQSVSLYE